MIKIDKDFSNVPRSLDSDLTKQRRQEVIKAGEYPTNLKKLQSNATFTVTTLSPYNSRYKYKDVKKKLKELYKRKCVYCEQKAPSYHVEHYRPKDIYYWLAYSWDNLLVSCSICNSHKGTDFEVVKRISIKDYPIDDIHNLGNVYDKIEQPKLVNPEKEDVYEDLIYTKEGDISSNNVRVQHTIKACEINREDLRDDRKIIWNTLKERIATRMTEYKSGDKTAKMKLRGFLEDFIKDSENPIKEFISFRKYIIKHWLKEIIAEHVS